MLQETVEVVPPVWGGRESSDGEPVRREVEDKGRLVSVEAISDMPDPQTEYSLGPIVIRCHLRASPPDQTQIKHLKRLEKGQSHGIDADHPSHLFQNRDAEETRVIHILARRTLFLCSEGCIFAPVKTDAVSQLSESECCDETHSVAMSAKSIAVYRFCWSRLFLPTCRQNRMLFTPSGGTYKQC